MHSIFYDATCPFCQKWKGRIKKWDKRHIFQFTPQKTDCSSMILIESNGKEWLRAKAVFRIMWLLKWYVPGCFYLLPSFLIDPVYNIIAAHRHKL
ncbi:MAG: DUF393 domain-containing protein [Chlamydiales bacterium]|nr:DUF393 domain-containing protein [Chlamydiales bacterium]